MAVLKKWRDIKLGEDVLENARKAYKYQAALTEKLDSHEGDFSEMTLLEIVLWKTNRYPMISQDLIDDINDLRKSYSEEKARALLRKMLNKERKGFDLPMASTVLRFAVPKELQIIDQRVFRFITQEPNLKLSTNIDKKINLYFWYIGMLKSVSKKMGIKFEESDRILYQLDKEHNGDISLQTS
jgi:thermostable 8-oxoguanine DNA glycosylase